MYIFYPVDFITKHFDEKMSFLYNNMLDKEKAF